MKKQSLISIILPSLLIIMAIISWFFIIRIPQETIKPIKVATADIQIPCAGDNNAQATKKMDDTQPSITATPPCGILSQQDGTPGTTITIHGTGFLPDTETELLWTDDGGNEFRHRQNGEYTKVTTDQSGEFQVDLIMPYRILPPSSTRDVAVWTLKAQQVKAEKEITTIEIKPIANHALISGLGWLLGSAIGLGLGFVIFQGLKSVLIAKPKTYEFIVLFPWWTILMSLFIPTLVPLIFIVKFGLGAKTGITSIGAMIFILSMAFTISIHLEHWRPSQPITRFIATSRTLATLSVVLTFIVGIFGGGGLGYTTIMEFRLLDFELAYRHYGAMVILMLIPDIVLGILQLHFIKRNSANQGDL